MAVLACVRDGLPDVRAQPSSPVGLQPGSVSRHCGGDATAAPSLTVQSHTSDPVYKGRFAWPGQLRLSPISGVSSLSATERRSDDDAVCHLSPISGIRGERSWAIYRQTASDI
jgi:hypothetical protein